jgi:hypothetical protein
MDQTLNEIGERLHPRTLLENLMNTFRSSPGGSSNAEHHVRDTVIEIGSNVADTIRNHPIPTALIGAGVGWLIVELSSGGAQPRRAIGRAGRRLRDSAGEMYERGKEKVRDFGHRISESTQEYGERMMGGGTYGHYPESEGMGGRLREQAGNLTESVQEGYEHARDAVGRTVRDYPLAVGAGALAVGLLVGLLLPRTRAEDELMGETSDEIIEGAREVVKQTYYGEQPSDPAKRAGEAVRSAAEEFKRDKP